MNVVRAVGGHRNQVRVDVLVQHGTVREDATLRVDVLDRVLTLDRDNLLLALARSAEINRPRGGGRQPPVAELHQESSNRRRFAIRAEQIERVYELGRTFGQGVRFVLFVEQQKSSQEVGTGFVQQRRLADLVRQLDEAIIDRLAGNRVKLVQQSVLGLLVTSQNDTLRRQRVKAGRPLNHQLHRLIISKAGHLRQVSHPVLLSADVVNSKHLSTGGHDHQHLVQTEIVPHQAGTLRLGWGRTQAEHVQHKVFDVGDLVADAALHRAEDVPWEKV